jgi:transcriptional regulator with XRE-family HTH domain
MGRRERPLERDGTPQRELAYWLRDLRNKSGLTFEQLARHTGFSVSTLHAAVSGNQLPSRQVTLAIVEACHSDEELWQVYWAQIRRLTDRDVPEGADRSVAPPWVGQPAQAGSANSEIDVGGTSVTAGESSVVPPGFDGVGGAGSDLVGQAAPSVQQSRSWRTRTRRLATIGGGLVIAAALAITVTALSVNHHGAAPGRSHSSLAVVVVQDKVAIGSSSLLEDTTAAYLSSQAIPRCRLRGCEVNGTDMWSGADLVVSCWVHGSEMTNEDMTSAGIAHNPNGATSTLWYRGRWPNGQTGYLSAVYVAPKYRGGMGLAACQS